jgi:hypothetical protein
MALFGRNSLLFSTLNNFIDDEHIVNKIIWDIIFREIIEIVDVKRRHKNVMFSLLANSHCCSCGHLIGFTRANKKYGYNCQTWDFNGYFHGKYCTISCLRFIEEHLDELGRYPRGYQSSGSFFANLNEKYSDVGLIDLSLQSTKL